MFFDINPKSFGSSVLIVSVIALLCGCSGDDSGLASVRGVVSADGKPLTEGQITFYPTGGRPAISKIQPDGTYDLTSFKKGDGVPPGKHKVTISARKTIWPNNTPPPTDLDAMIDSKVKGKTVWLVPKKYSEFRTSNLTAEVKEGEANEINFDSADFK